MGNAIPGMPDMRLSEIKELVEKMMTTFTPLYVKEYGVALITQEKEKRKPADVIPYHLFSMPPMSDPIKAGFLVKLVSWKLRSGLTPERCPWLRQFLRFGPRPRGSCNIDAIFNWQCA
jgi:hypothetical protein